MATSKCSHCKETVYPLERLVLAEQVFHKGCAKCAHCQGTLSLSSFASIGGGTLYCKPHYLELFKASGGKYNMQRDESSASVVERAEPAKIKKANPESPP